ncbi:MAG TPA: DUF2905 domain-containing protein [Anaeromyxobacteraceae bacterium]|nr:DUF2905 domain-containing protein [Anaeromyxobacteraceae bacterium]
MLGTLGRLLLVLGLVLAAVGALLVAADRFPWLRLGRLPGDLVIERERFKLYLPLGTSLVLSAAATLLLWLLGRGR